MTLLARLIDAVRQSPRPMQALQDVRALGLRAPWREVIIAWEPG